MSSKNKVSVDLSQMSSGDLIESSYMLQASATLLRQSFGIVMMSNDLLDDKLSQEDLKTFAKNFDNVHEVCRGFSHKLGLLANDRRKEEQAKKEDVKS